MTITKLYIATFVLRDYYVFVRENLANVTQERS